MSLKGGIVQTDLPEGLGNDFGGAKGVMCVPEGTLASPELKADILRDYVSTQYEKGVLGVEIDRHAPDMNTGPGDMDVMAQALVDITGNEQQRAAFSGKSVEHGGLEGREIATGQGLVYTLESHLNALERNPKGMTVAVQGSGNVGYHFARLAAEQLGVKIVGVSDKNRAIVADANTPLRIGDTIEFENGVIRHWDTDMHRQLKDRDDLLEADADIFVFAAAPDTITQSKNNQDRLKAPIILQGANNPMDSEAIDFYLENNRSIVPDILGNAGGFVASNIEYNQGMTGQLWTEKMVLDALRQVMDKAYGDVHAEAAAMNNERNLVDAALRLAIKRQYEHDSRTGLLVATG